MSKDNYSLIWYLSQNKSIHTQRFLNLFGDQINDLPDKIVSSKILIQKYLKVDTTEKYRVFQALFMDYFKHLMNA